MAKKLPDDVKLVERTVLNAVGTSVMDSGGCHRRPWPTSRTGPGALLLQKAIDAGNANGSGLNQTTRVFQRLVGLPLC